MRIYQEIGGRKGEANAFWTLGDLAFRTGNLEEAQHKYEAALRIYQEIDVKIGEANTLRALGDLAMWTFNLEEAKQRYKKALGIYRNADARDGEARIFIRLAQWAALTDDLDQAEINLSNASAIYKEIKDLEGQADAHLVKALTFLKHRDMTKARHQLDLCSYLQDRICAHSEAAQWLILYTVHFRLHDFREGAAMCLKYAWRFASKTRNQHLLDHIK